MGAFDKTLKLVRCLGDPEGHRLSGAGTAIVEPTINWEPGPKWPLSAITIQSLAALG